MPTPLTPAHWSTTAAAWFTYGSASTNSHHRRGPDTVRIRAYDLRSNAQEALFRAQMLTDDVTLSQAAEDVLTDVTTLSKTDSRTELDVARVRTRDDISRLVRAAKQHL